VTVTDSASRLRLEDRGSLLAHHHSRPNHGNCCTLELHRTDRSGYPTSTRGMPRRPRSLGQRRQRQEGTSEVWRHCCRYGTKTTLAAVPTFGQSSLSPFLTCSDGRGRNRPGAWAGQSRNRHGLAKAEIGHVLIATAAAVQPAYKWCRIMLLSQYAHSCVPVLLTLLLSESDDITVPRRSFARLAAKRPAGARCRLQFHESMFNL